MILFCYLFYSLFFQIISIEWAIFSTFISLVVHLCELRDWSFHSFSVLLSLLRLYTVRIIDLEVAETLVKLICPLNSTWRIFERIDWAPANERLGKWCATHKWSKRSEMEKNPNYIQTPRAWALCERIHRLLEIF